MKRSSPEPPQTTTENHPLVRLKKVGFPGATHFIGTPQAIDLDDMPKALTIEFGPINDNNVEMLRKVNAACFPVSYSDKFYKDVVARKDDGLNKFAYYGGFVVGAVCTRVEPLPEDDVDKSQLYIMTLGVLAAYRGRDVGTQLIQSILRHYEEHKDDQFRSVTEIALHVQISNNDAIKFYTERFGFIKGEMVENYYRRIDPPHCYRLYKKLP